MVDLYRESMEKRIVTYSDEDCPECDGTGCMPTSKYTPTYEEMINPSPRMCDECDGHGKKILSVDYE